MKVLVVGAGPAGAATALLLARYGLDVTLIEREASFERVFRGEGLMPLGIDALFEMGIGEVLRTVPGRRVESWNIWIDGEEVFAVPKSVEELGERAVRVVSQPALLECVVEEASRYPSFSFQRGARVRDLIRARMAALLGLSLRRRTAGGRCKRTSSWAATEGAPLCARARVSSSSCCPNSTTCSGLRCRRP